MRKDIMKWSGVALVFLISVLPYGHGYYSSSRQEENSEKLSTLEKQVKVLTNELVALKEDVKVLKGETSPEPDPDVLPVEASRTMRPGGRVRFTVKYKAKPTVSDQIRIFWVDTDSYAPIRESLSNEVPFLPPDVYQTSIETEASDTTHVSLSVGTMDFWYRLNIKNSLEGNAVQIITSLPEGHVTPPKDIVYEPGTNASLQLTGPLEDQGREDPGFHGPDNMDLQFYINPPGSDDILEKYGDRSLGDSFVSEGHIKTFLDKKEIGIVFNTSVVAYSGLLMVMIGDNYRDDLVYRIEKNYMLTLRPSNQSGAFREGFLAPRFLSWIETNKNGDFVEHCRPGELCRAYCHFFGNNLNQVVILRTVNGVAKTVVPLYHEEGRHFSYAMDTFHMTSSPNPVNYTCVGSDAGGQQAVSTYLFYLQDPPKFVDDQTTIKVTPDNEANVTCTATGFPLPQINITFVLPNSMESEDVGYNHQVLYQTNDTISVSKVMSLNGTSPETSYVFPLSMYASCYAFSTGGGSTKILNIGDDPYNLTMTYFDI